MRQLCLVFVTLSYKSAEWEEIPLEEKPSRCANWATRLARQYHSSHVRNWASIGITYRIGIIYRLFLINSFVYKVFF